jgi:hypothetical protein
MSRIKLTSFDPFKHLYESTWIERDLYRLLAFTASSQALAELCQDKDIGHAIRYLRRMEIPEIRHLLVSTAIFIRQATEDPGGVSKGQTQVGWLIQSDKNEKVSLSLREACNKIIHAEGFDPLFIETSMNDHIGQSIAFSGKHQATSWTCHIDVPMYVSIGLEMV